MERGAAIVEATMHRLRPIPLTAAAAILGLIPIASEVLVPCIVELTPGAAVKIVASAELSQGVIAYAAIRAPTGLAQAVIFQWRHGGHSEAIVEEIRGGNQSGWRTYSRKQIFPADARGKWTVDILTPQGQLLKRPRFTVS